MRYETEKLGSRPERMAALLESLGMVSSDDENGRRSMIEQSQQAIEIRRTLTGRRNKWKLGENFINLSFAMTQWADEYGSEWLSADQAQLEAQVLVKQAIEVFTELNDPGQLANAIMTDAVIMDTGPLQIERFKEAETLCARALGEKCNLMTFICNNIGYSYEAQGLLDLAYEYFRKCYSTRVEVHGLSHPETNKMCYILNQQKYRAIAEGKGDPIPEYH